MVWIPLLLENLVVFFEVKLIDYGIRVVQMCKHLRSRHVGIANLFVTEQADVILIDRCNEDCFEGPVRLLICVEFVELVLVPTSDIRNLRTSEAVGDRRILIRVCWRKERYRGLRVVDCRIDCEEQQSQPAVAAMGINGRRVCIHF